MPVRMWTRHRSAAAQSLIDVYDGGQLLPLAAPTILAGAGNGDNAVFATVVSGMAGWIGSFDGTMVAAGSDGAAVICVPTEGLIAGINLTDAPTIYALIEARAAYSPVRSMAPRRAHCRASNKRRGSVRSSHPTASNCSSYVAISSS